MCKVAGLWKRGNVWQFRIKIPTDLKQRINKFEVNTSLKTKDYRTAISKCRVLALEFETWFSDLRTQSQTMNSGVGKVLPKTVTHQPKITEQENVINQSNIHQQNVPLSTPSSYQEMQIGLPKVTIRELYRRYMDDPSIVRSPKTILTYESVSAVLIDLLGPNKPIQNISRDDCRELMDIIRYLPANAKKKFPKKSLVSISKAAKKKGTKPMAPQTINKYMSKLSALLNFAVEEEMILRNPAKGLRVADPVHMQNKRLPFSDNQLSRIFSALNDNRSRKSEYWVPYISLFSGMRLNEICQMDINDVQRIDDIWCFSITLENCDGNTDKKLKTASSERRIPIHPYLLKLGFINYLNSLNSKKSKKLFPDLKPTTTGYRSDAFSRSFSKFLKSIKVHTPKNSFHSFRHNFRDALREGNVRFEVGMYLGGWKDGSQDRSSQNFYGSGFTTTTLFKEISRIQYPNLFR